ncbi:MAG TPA: metalloregulator ArsR/SmtB family transcription factor [Tepidisphaeraceae bacterium]|jgi:DNA-binding transcriptional ArsR family regulator|nr:metalloregulator ArsR/SmtB family transcription factor [Tepidisphaeraceae bacterium]
MARAATTADVFNAIAEPRRRQIIDLLGDTRARPVGEVVEFLGLSQPAVSKHLGVLRKVGLVSVTHQGQQRLYRLNPQELKPVNDWVKPFERYWTQQVDRIKRRAEEKAARLRLPDSHETQDSKKEKP